jgi:hypothetical protein
MRELALGSLVLASLPLGCLEGNPQFDAETDEGASTGTTAASDDGASSLTPAEESTSTGAPVECIDLFEPNDDDDSEVSLGVLDAAVSDADDLDKFKTFAFADQQIEIRAELDDPSLTVCVFPACEGEGNPTTPMGCRTGNSIADEFGAPGCCGSGAAQLAYTCATTFDTVVQLNVSGDVATCTPYHLEITAVVPP